MATSKKPPKKKLPTGPTKADLLSRMGVNKQPEWIEPEPTAADRVNAPQRLRDDAPQQRAKDDSGTESLDLPHPLAAGVESGEPFAAASRQSTVATATTPPSSPFLASAPSIPEDPLPDADPLPEPSPDPVEDEGIASPALPPQVNRAEWASTVLKTELQTELQAELLPPTTAPTGNGNGVHRNGTGYTPQPDPLPLPPTPKPAAALPDPRDALDAQLGLQKLTLKCSAEMVEKLGSLQSTTGLPGEILLEVLLDHWEQLPKPLQQDCLMQAHRIRVERLVISQNYTIATIEQLLIASALPSNNEQHLP
jgi:hypothetical protein